MKYRASLSIIAIFSASSAGSDEFLLPPIAEVEEAAEEYASDYTERTGHLMPNAMSGINYKEHLCLILTSQLVLDLLEKYELDYPPAAEVDTDDLIYWYSTLDSWIVAAREVIVMTKYEKEALWNSEC